MGDMVMVVFVFFYPAPFVVPVSLAIDLSGSVNQLLLWATRPVEGFPALIIPAWNRSLRPEKIVQ